MAGTLSLACNPLKALKLSNCTSARIARKLDGFGWFFRVRGLRAPQVPQISQQVKYRQAGREPEDKAEGSCLSPQEHSCCIPHTHTEQGAPLAQHAIFSRP